MGAERRTAAAVAVDLLYSGTDVVVAHVQHVEAGCRWRCHQGRTVQQGKTALCQSRLEVTEAGKMRPVHWTRVIFYLKKTTIFGNRKIKIENIILLLFTIFVCVTNCVC